MPTLYEDKFMIVERNKLSAKLSKINKDVVFLRHKLFKRNSLILRVTAGREGFTVKAFGGEVKESPQDKSIIEPANRTVTITPLKRGKK